MNPKDYINLKFGRLLIKSIFTPNNKYRFKRCIATCECGVTKDFDFQSVKRGLSKSCGCLNSELARNRQLGVINNSKYVYNEAFFDTVSPDSSYVLGLMYSDGCMEKDTNMFKIVLKYSDSDILNKISFLIKGDKSIYRIGGNGVAQFTNKYLYKSLTSWGLYPNKSTTLTVDPRLKFNPDFWRGVIDGDGSIYERKGRKMLSLCGTFSVVDSFRDFCLSKFIQSKSHVSIKKGYSFDFSEYTISGDSAFTIANIIYKNSNLHLYRKFKIFQSWH